MMKPITERISSTWNTLSSAVVARPAIDIARNDAIDPAIQSAALRLDGCCGMRAIWQAGAPLATFYDGHSTGPAASLVQRLGGVGAAAFAEGVAGLYRLAPV